MQSGQGDYISAAVRVLNGKYRDALLKIAPKEKLIIGRDVKECHFVLEAPWVSRKHCVISYDYEQKIYEVIDYSENGTFVGVGERLIKEQPKRLESGVILTIGEDGVSLQLT